MGQREETMKAMGFKDIDQDPGPSGTEWMEKVAIDGTTAYVSGHTSGNFCKGKVPSDVPVDTAFEAAAAATSGALRSVRAALGSLDRVDRVLRVTGYVNADNDFHEVSKVIHGASELLYKVFGESGKHARTALGMAQLPSNTTVEVEMILKIKP